MVELPLAPPVPPLACVGPCVPMMAIYHLAWPNNLKVQIDCRSRMDIEMALDVWPALPFSICSSLDGDPNRYDIIASLEHRERITEVDWSGLSGP